MIATERGTENLHNVNKAVLLTNNSIAMFGGSIAEALCKDDVWYLKKSPGS